MSTVWKPVFRKASSIFLPKSISLRIITSKSTGSRTRNSDGGIGDRCLNPGRDSRLPISHHTFRLSEDWVMPTFVDEFDIYQEIHMPTSSKFTLTES